MLIVENTLIRLTSYFLVYCLVQYFPSDWQFPIAITASVTHYLTALIYGRKQLFEIPKKRHLLLPFSFVLLITLLFTTYFRDTIFFVFLAHHALSEAYPDHLHRNFKKKYSAESLLSCTKLLFEIGLILVLIPNDPHLDFFTLSTKTTLFIFATLIHATAIGFSYKQQRDYTLNIASTSLTSLLCLAGLHLTGLTNHLSIMHIIIYHVFTWVFMPAKNMRSSGARSLTIYILTTFVLMLFLGQEIFSANNSTNRDKYDMYYNLFINLGFIHIFLSLLLSNKNPRLLMHVLGTQRR